MEIKREMEISSIEEMCELMCGIPEESEESDIEEKEDPEA